MVEWQLYTQIERQAERQTVLQRLFIDHQAKSDRESYGPDRHAGGQTDR